MYNDLVMDHFNNPRNVGVMQGADGVGVAEGGGCGDVIRISIRVRDNVIDDVRFQTFGCGAAIATSSMVTEMVKGRSLEEARKITNEDVARALGGLPPQKMHCSNLGADALGKAIKDYLKKNPDVTVDSEEPTREQVYERRFGGVRDAIEARVEQACCPYCKSTIPVESAVCDPCGRDLTHCEVCGKPIKPPHDNCPECDEQAS